jgi:hypothetical protein
VFTGSDSREGIDRADMGRSSAAPVHGRDDDGAAGRRPSMLRVNEPLSTNAVGSDGYDPLFAPGGGFEGGGEVLGFVDNFGVVAEFHDADGEGGLAFVFDGVFGDPDVAAADDALDFETGWLAGVMAPQGFQICGTEDAFAGLGIVADGLVGVDLVFGVHVAGGRGLPVFVEGGADSGFLFWREVFAL